MDARLEGQSWSQDAVWQTSLGKYLRSSLLLKGEGAGEDSGVGGGGGIWPGPLS